MNRTLYLECYSGISGDMTVGALLDLGADQKKLKELLNELPFDGYQLKMERCKKCGIDSFSFDVILEDRDTHHHEENDHSSHMNRNLYDINKILDAITDEKIKRLSKRMFEIVARAEAKAHQLPIEDVHFHEVGAIDSIVDIVSAAFCVCDLGIDEVVVSTLYEGQGHVTCQHGILPVPVPATLNIVCDYGLTLKITENQGEMVTPTGAAIAAALKTKETLPENVTILATGIGAGKKEFKTANILRAMLFENKTADDETFEHSSDSIWMLQTNIDDCTGEALSYTMETLFAIGAKDVYYTPIYMKKNRPAYLLSVICAQESIKKCEDMVFANTTTIGIRRYPMERTTLKREIRSIETIYGAAKVKVCEGNHGVKLYPEYESVKELCTETGLDYQTLYHEVMECAKKSLNE